MQGIIRLYHILSGVILQKPLALCDAGDLDGIGSAALFKMKYPNGKIILAYPNEVKSSFLFKLIKWEFVADLPCPGKAKIRADHHETNKPCADNEFFDPNAPASAVLALRALGLENNVIAKTISKYAVETDTANIVSEEARKLDAAVKGSNYVGRVYIAEKLATIGLDILNDKKVIEYINKFDKIREKTERISSNIKLDKEVILVFTKDLNLSYRYLSILLERKGAFFTFIVVPKKYFKIRIYVGARPSTKYNSSIIAKKFNGGGHQFAAGATLTTLYRKKMLEKILNELKVFLKKKKITIQKIYDENNIEIIII